MLVLTRKLNQEIVIEGGITIKVMAVRGKQVKLGINAPDAVSVLRKEIVDREHERTNRTVDGAEGITESKGCDTVRGQDTDPSTSINARD